MVFRLSLVTVTIAALLASVSGQQLRLKVSGPAQVSDIADLTVTTTLTNAGADKVILIKEPSSALSSSPAHTFNLFHDSGSTPEFTGILYKYSLEKAAKNPETLVTLAPGASIEVSHSLAGTYNFTRSGSGSYNISPSTLFYVVNAEGTAEQVHAVLQNTHAVSFSSGSRLAVSPPVAARSIEQRGLSKRAAYSSCSSTRQTQIAAAIPAAVSYVSESLSYLNAHTTTSTRVVTWFGTWSSSKRTTLITQYTSLQATGSYTDWTYDCACTDGDSNTYAYVYPSQYGTINLCGAFWSAPTTGTDSKAGTLIHESTHFTKTAGTSDYAYGQTAAKALAISNPSHAVLNADSHEYFSENNPSLA
ncbi:hypothetical protein M422DRAFT_778645 [Sphaerobolus stellatus SS14]|uniref:Lysine-specific metallo-endopeptidase domain-containing protein n=1 Tax=Sphaerobolus stellatus (strain SS14) TaxID=990650 RepID=A0A0C9W2L8_SPHS4|nr:hypothetical protein M422DRAFT_778645 [Sphaerobolus stellatus SS14]